MKAIHNIKYIRPKYLSVVLYLKDTQKWKQFTTIECSATKPLSLCYISKILKNESNSQQSPFPLPFIYGCVISQRYSKMKAIHNSSFVIVILSVVVLYLKDTQKWKQFTTLLLYSWEISMLCYISKILKNESNSQRFTTCCVMVKCCVISQRYSKMKAIHNFCTLALSKDVVVLYLKDTQKWKQFTTEQSYEL